MAMSPTILFLGLPPKTFVGINLASFNSSPNFLGITNLPKGLLFLYTGTDAFLSIRHGLWLNIRPTSTDTEIITLTWNNDLEHLEQVDAGSTQSQEITRRLPELQKKGLLDFAALRDASANLRNEQSDHQSDSDGQNSGNIWPALTSHITSRVLTRVLSSKDRDKSSTKWALTSVSAAPSDTEHIPGLTSMESRLALEPLQTLNLMPMDLKQTWPEDAVGRSRTEMARDRSWYLKHLISHLTMPDVVHEGGEGEVSQSKAASELLGELQFCFLMVLCLANYSCLEQWKRLLTVLFTCRSALTEVEGFFVEVLKVLRQQLGRVDDVEGGLFELSDESSSAWLRKLLKTFRATVEEVYADAADSGGSEEESKNVRKVLDELEKWLGEKYGWEDEKNTLRRGMVQLEDGEMVELQADDLDKDEETGEYAPVVVETGLAYSGSLD